MLRGIVIVQYIRMRMLYVYVLYYSILLQYHSTGHCTRAHLRLSFSYLRIQGTHHAEIGHIFRPINYAFDTGHNWRISVIAQVQLNILLKHICSLPLAHRPKRRPTGYWYTVSQHLVSLSCSVTLIAPGRVCMRAGLSTVHSAPAQYSRAPASLDNTEHVSVHS